MSGISFAMHYQSAWEERAGNPDLPLWLRVAALAYGKHLRNGHANFRPGDVALVLSTVNRHTGELMTPRRQSVGQAIKAAVRYGFLAEGSGSTCLVVPAHTIRGGAGREGTEGMRCPVHQPKIPRQRRKSVNAE